MNPTTIANTFERDGYVTGLPILKPDEVTAFRQRIDAFEQTRTDDVSWAFDIKSNLLFDWVYRMCCHPALLKAVGPLVGDDILLTNATFRIKQPGSSQNYGWHQDSARIQVEPCFVIAFLALSEQTRENGCLEVIPGSHKEVHTFKTLNSPAGQEKRRVARTENVDESQAVALELKAGEVAVFSGNLIHGSGPNTSQHERCSLLIDYTATCARQHVGRGSGQLIQGVDQYTYTAPEPVPSGDCLDRDVINRRKVLNQWPENPLMGPLPDDGVVMFPDSGTIGF